MSILDIDSIQKESQAVVTASRTLSSYISSLHIKSSSNYPITVKTDTCIPEWFRYHLFIKPTDKIKFSHIVRTIRYTVSCSYDDSTIITRRICNEFFERSGRSSNSWWYQLKPTYKALYEDYLSKII